MSTPSIFISYAHENTDWLQAVRDTLVPLVHGGIVSTWWDGKIAPGDRWREKIDAALESAELAILLVSIPFLASEFIRDVELPYLFEAADDGRVRLLWIPVGDALFEETRLGELQAVHDPEKPLNTLSEGHADQALAAIGREVAGLLKGSGPTPQTVKTPSLKGLQRVSTAKLPTTPHLLLGREDQLAQLTAAWDAGHTHVLSIVAPGGVGKTALVNRWLGDMARGDYRGARRVYGWSFYSQGVGESKNASGEPFIDAALDWFGDPDPTAGSPWQRGERLAELVRQARTLLILDGLEPLQEPPRTGLPTGRLKDPGLQVLLRNLSASNHGLCLITTREPVEDLDSKVGATVERLDLTELTPEAGAAVLRAYKLEAPQEELEEISEAFAGHALALTLLATYLRDVCDGDVRGWKQVPILEEDAGQGAHAFRVMRSYEDWLGKGAELAVLYLLGLFDRPASQTEIDALLKEPAIPGLTDDLVKAGDVAWRRAVARLREARLVSDPGGPGEAGGLDAHPLVRTYFGERLAKTNPDAYRAGHLRLYEHLKQAAPYQPDTLEEMQPLFHAVIHGCRARRAQEVMADVFSPRIRRKNHHYSVNKLGAWGSDLAALSGFFERPWDRPNEGLSKANQSFVLHESGFALRAQGRLVEAVAPIRAGLSFAVGVEDNRNVVAGAGNLSELLLTLGRVEDAVEAARECLDVANTYGSPFWRILGRITLAHVLHQAGRVEKAWDFFEEAETLQADREPRYPLLYSQLGYRYCDLLLDVRTQICAGTGVPNSRQDWMFLESYNRGDGALDSIRQRAEMTLEWGSGAKWYSLLSIAFDHLTLGRTHLALATTAGAPEPDPTHLERARLRVSLGQTEEAREDLEAARTLVEETGYQRRDPEVAALAGVLVG